MSDPSLNSGEEHEMIERLSQIARSGMPLSDGLRAAASEVGSRRLRRHLNKLATEFDSGADWQQLLEREDLGVRPHVLGIVKAGLMSGDIGDALDGLVDQERVYRDLWRELYGMLAYPAALVLASVALVLCALLFVVPQFDEIFKDFGTTLPAFTQLLLNMSKVVPRVALVGGFLIVVTLASIRIFGGASGWMRFLSAIPVIGPLIHFAGVAQMLRMLEILLRQRLPLPEALSLTSDGVCDANVKRVASWLADGVSAGIPFSELLMSTPQLPGSIAPVIAWGESNNSLPAALNDAYDLLEGSIRLHKSILTLVVGPLMLVFIAVTFGLMTVGLMMPLVSLIQNLT